MIDKFSKWPEIGVTKSTKFEKLLSVLERSFATHGVPGKIVHDNGPPYNSQAWIEFAASSGFTSHACTPKHPQANGLAEKMMASIAKLVHASLAEGKDPKVEIQRFLMNYRNTPHPSTGYTPSRLLMGRIIKTKILALIQKVTGSAHVMARKKNKEAKQKAKEYADKRRRAKERLVKVGDKVFFAQDNSTTKQPFDPTPYTVTKVVHAQVTDKRNWIKIVRNLGKCKVVKQRPKYLQVHPQAFTRKSLESKLSDFDLIEENKDQVPMERKEAGLDQANEVGGLDQVDEVEGLDQAGEVAGLDQAEEVEDSNQADEAEGSNQVDEVVGSDQADEVLSENTAPALVPEEEATWRQRRRPDRYGDWEYDEMEEH